MNTSAPIHLAWLACGSADVKVQARYAAESALAWRGDAPLALHVYTDDARPFAPLARAGVEVVEVGPETERGWRGPEDLVFRMKPCIALDLARRFPSEPVGLVDADTFFVAPVAELAARVASGRAVMHLREYHVGTEPSEQMKKFRRAMSKLSFRDRPVDLDAFMWNSGVLLVHPAQFPLLEEWLAFVDAIYPQYRKAFVEQYGVGLLLQKRAEVVACDDLVFHYWFQKDEYVAAIRDELAALDRLPVAAQGDYLRAHRLALPPPVERKHKRKSLWARFRAALGR
jgi:hypothetical protein